MPLKKKMSGPFETPRPAPEPLVRPISQITYNQPTLTSAIRSGTDDTVPELKTGARFYLVFVTLAVITMMVALDGTSLSVALPIISQDLNGPAIEAFWSGTSFLLASTVFQPSFASFSHIFGRKPMILIALVIFLIGSIVAGLASKGFANLLVGRSIQGVGGGGLIALTEIVVTDLVSLRLRARWIGVITGTWSFGSVCGPVIGGTLAEKSTWRWIFWINFPFIGVALMFVLLFMRLKFKPTNLADQLKRIDWIGSVLFIGSLTSFLIPITWGGVSYPWYSWRTLVPLIVGVFGLLVFIVFEEKVPTEPLIRLAIFKNRTAAISYLGTIIHGMILWSNLYYLPLYFEAVKEESPILAGVSMFPQTFTVAPAAVVVGIVISATGRYRWAIWSGWVLTTVGFGLLYLLDVHTATAAWVFLNLVSGVGMGMLFTSMAQAIQAAASNRDLAFAVAMFSFFRAFGQAIGVAVGGTIFQNQLRQSLAKYPTFVKDIDKYTKDASGLVQIIKSMPAGPDKLNLQQSYADALKVVWATMCGLAGLALITSLWTKGLSLDRPLETEQGLEQQINVAEDVEKRRKYSVCD